MNYHSDKRNRPIDFSLTTADIEYAQPGKRGLDWNRRTNPLEPQYTLPTFQTKPTTPPKFIRDSIPVHDIERAQVKTIIDTTKPAGTRHLKVNDIDGTWPDYMRMRSNFKYTTGNPKPSYAFETADINAPPGRVASVRGTDPLNPTYTHTLTSTFPQASSNHLTFSQADRVFGTSNHGTSLQAGSTIGGGMTHGFAPGSLSPNASLGAPKGTFAATAAGPTAGTNLELGSIGHIEGSQPRIRARELKNTVCNINKADDIELAQPQRFVGHMPFNIHTSTFTRDPLGPLRPEAADDIPGAQAMTLPKGIEQSTRRSVNPLQPQYTWDKTATKRQPPGPHSAPPSYLPDHDIITNQPYRRPNEGASVPVLSGQINEAAAAPHPMAGVLPAGSSYFPNRHIASEFHQLTADPWRAGADEFCAPGTVPPEFAPSVGGYIDAQRSGNGSHQGAGSVRSPQQQGNSHHGSQVYGQGSHTGGRAPSNGLSVGSQVGAIPSHLLRAAGASSVRGSQAGGSVRGSQPGSFHGGGSQVASHMGSQAGSVRGGGVGISKATANLLASHLQTDAAKLR